MPTDKSSSDLLWDGFVDDAQRLQREISRLETLRVSSTELRKSAKEIGRKYFRSARPLLRQLHIDDKILFAVDQLIQALLQLSSSPNPKASYMDALGKIGAALDELTILRERCISESVESGDETSLTQLSAFEQLVFDTLTDLVPSAARSYKQAILDLADVSRLSYRGAANELREALRETLDGLAPDADVSAQKGFALEEGQTTPTRKQKVRFILKSRGSSTSAAKVPEGIIETIEDKVSAVVGATYGRVNNAAHVQTERIEVLRIKKYIDAVLSELLALPADT